MIPMLIILLSDITAFIKVGVLFVVLIIHMGKSTELQTGHFPPSAIKVNLLTHTYQTS